MTQEEVTEYILGLQGVTMDKSLGEHILTYKTDNGAMFALVQDGKNPVRLSLRCDPLLAKHLRQKYDEVMQGDHLSPDKWNTIVLAGQLSPEEVKDLIRHSYILVNEEN